MFRPHPRRLRPFVSASVLVLTFLITLGWPSPAYAYPWMLRHGYQGCSTCHSDPSGGEVLTPYGRAQGELLLTMPWQKSSNTAAASTSAEANDSFDALGNFEEPGSTSTAAPEAETNAEPSVNEAGGPPSTGFLWGLWDTPDWLLLGGSMRVAGTNSNGGRFFPMQFDLYGELRVWKLRAGGSIGVARIKENSANGRAAFVTTNQGNQFNLLSRWHWLGFAVGPHDELLVRAGRLNLPFGVRIPEHFMWVREATRTDRDSDQQHGLAIAFDGSTFRTEVMGIAGNYQIPALYRERGYSAYFEANVTESVALGASSLVTVADADRVSLEQDKTTRGAHGLFSRAHVAGPVVMLAEADVLHTSRRELGYTAFVQGDWEVIQGLHGMATAEVLDQGYRKPVLPGINVERYSGVGRPALGGWLSAAWWFLPQLDLRLDLILRQNSGAFVLGQLHAYL